MSAKLSDSVWEQRKRELLGYLSSHPDARKQDVKEYDSTVSRFFNKRFNEAKLAAGVNKSHVRGNIRLLNEDEWEGRRIGLLSFLRTHPSAGYYDILVDPPLFPAYRKFYRYNGGMHQLRIDAGIIKPNHEEERRDRFLKYLRSQPTVTLRGVIRAGYGGILKKWYERRLTDARLAAGLDVSYVTMYNMSGRSDLVEMKREAFLKWLRKNPETTGQQASALHPYAYYKIYKSRINDAKRDAGVPVRDINEWRKEFAEMQRR